METFIQILGLIVILPGLFMFLWLIGTVGYEVPRNIYRRYEHKRWMRECEIKRRLRERGNK